MTTEPAHTVKHIPMKKSGRACLFSIAFCRPEKQIWGSAKIENEEDRAIKC